MAGGDLFILAEIAMHGHPVVRLSLKPELLAAGGFGSSAFANMQSSLVVLHAPMHIRSRLMGLLTVCIGMGPLGILLVGFLADWLGPMLAIEVTASTGFVSVVLMGVWWWRRERRTGRDADR